MPVAASMCGLIMAAAAAEGVSAETLSSVCWVESRHQPSVIRKNDGRGHSFGMCQVKEKTARWLGFKGKVEDLLKPGVNLLYAARYLARQIRRYGNEVKGISAYNAGHFTPSNKPYVSKVMEAKKESLYGRVCKTASGAGTRFYANTRTKEQVKAYKRSRN